MTSNKLRADKILLIPIIIFSMCSHALSQQSFSLYSPDDNTEVTIDLGNRIHYSVRYDGKQVLKPSPLSLTIQEHGTLGANPELTDTYRRSVDEIIEPVVRQKSAEIINRYNEITLSFENDYKVVFRVYNDGIAYRFVTDIDSEDLKISSEEIQFNFAGDYKVYFPQEQSFMTHQERSYKHLKISAIDDTTFGSIPTLVEADKGPKLLISEADLQDYPGFYLQGTGSAAFNAIFPNVATKETLKRDRDYYVTERADYLAETTGERSFPWRVMGIAKEDKDLVMNQLIYKLAPPLQIENTNWINPGKVSWDWWNANNIYDVDFRAGINTETYKYYIDFASEMGLEYIILDEGWYELGDLLSVSEGMDIPDLVEYGKKKDVNIILWVVWKTLDDQWEQAFEQFSKWGVKGIKVDFMQRDDQWMVNWYWRVAKEAAKRKLLVDFHGSYKPTGIRRAYPNAISREGVKGLENDKWSKEVTPQHDVTIPFIRMAAGPMDFTPGAMINAQPDNFEPVYNRPMSMGTRAHQLAMYVVYESPLQMLADSPTHYKKEKQDIRDFLSEVPVTWDETRVLEASVGKYIVVARKKGSTWYIGAMTNEKSRNFTLDLSFLEDGEHTAKIYSDGINADSYGSDYQFSKKKVTKDTELKINLSKGGGWVAIVE